MNPGACARMPGLRSAEILFVNGQSFDEISPDMIAETGGLRDADRSLGRYSNLGFDDVFEDD